MSVRELVHHDLLKQVPKNALANILSFSLHVIVGIWFVPYLIRHLGIAAYGLIPLAASMANYAGLVTISISGSVGRFLTIDIQNNNKESANKTLNTAFWSLFLLCLLLLVGVVFFSLYADKIFVVPHGIEMESRWLFFLVLSAFLLNTMAGPIGAVAHSNNRLDLANYVSMTGTLIRLAFIVLFFALWSESLLWVGLGYLIGGAFVLLGHYRNGKNLAPYLRLSPQHVEKNRLKEMGVMGGWVLVNQVGSLLFLQVELILANRLLGASPAGEYAAIMQWTTLIRSMAGIAAGVMNPLVMISYARNDFAGVEGISKKAVFFMGVGIAFPIGLLCGLAPNVLSIWLGSQYAKLAPLMMLTLGHLVINLAVLPLFIINVAYNRVKLPGIVTLIMGAANVGLALVFVLFFDMGMYGIALAGATMLTLKNAIFTPCYAATLLGKKYSFFLVSMAKSVLAASVLGLTVFSLSKFIPVVNWKSLILFSGALFILYIPAVWFTLVNMEEKIFIISMLPAKLLKSAS